MVSFACFIAGISTCFVKNELYSYVIGIHFVLIDDNKYLIQMHWLIKLRWQVTSSSIRFVSSTSWKLQNDWKAPFQYSINVASRNASQVYFLHYSIKNLLGLPINNILPVQKRNWLFSLLGFQLYITIFLFGSLVSALCSPVIHHLCCCISKFATSKIIFLNFINSSLIRNSRASCPPLCKLLHQTLQYQETNDQSKFITSISCFMSNHFNFAKFIFHPFSM